MAIPAMQVLARTGTDDRPMYAHGAAFQQPAAPAAPMPVMTNVSPSGTVGGASVWGTGRSERSQATERVNQLSSSGLDDYEIPAFLRKQAD